MMLNILVNTIIFFKFVFCLNENIQQNCNYFLEDNGNNQQIAIDFCQPLQNGHDFKAKKIIQNNNNNNNDCGSFQECYYDTEDCSDNANGGCYDIELDNNNIKESKCDSCICDMSIIELQANNKQLVYALNNCVKYDTIDDGDIYIKINECLNDGEIILYYYKDENCETLYDNYNVMSNGKYQDNDYMYYDNEPYKISNIYCFANNDNDCNNNNDNVNGRRLMHHGRHHRPRPHPRPRPPHTYISSSDIDSSAKSDIKSIKNSAKSDIQSIRSSAKSDIKSIKNSVKSDIQDALSTTSTTSGSSD